MASMSGNAVLKKWTNEEMRPVAESLQAIREQIGSLVTRYTNQVLPELNSFNADDVMDDRVGEGIASPTQVQHKTMATLLNNLHTNLSAAGVAELLDDFAVRPPRTTPGS